MQNYDLVVAAREPSTVKVELASLPQNESDTIARVLLHSIDKAFKNPTIAAEYERWKQERNIKKATAQAAGSR